MFDQKEHKVQLIEMKAHEYIITARTEEEAITIAEGLLDDGEEGFILSSEVEQADAYPYTDEGVDEEED